MLWATFSSGLPAAKRLNACCFLVATSMVISIIFELFENVPQREKRGHGTIHLVK
jgi:hypothetical protein